jgi:prepilin peptidase CpaA
MGGYAVSVSFVIAMLVLLTAGAWRDIATRTIPDEVNALLLTAGGLARLFQGPPVLFYSVSAALLLFLLLMAAYSRGLIGGGDVKLMTALAIGLSPFDCYRFVVATALAGGILGIAYLLLSSGLRPMRKSRGSSLLGRVLAVETWRIRRHGPLPYGVAIAAGGAFVLLHPGSF